MKRIAIFSSLFGLLIALQAQATEYKAPTAEAENRGNVEYRVITDIKGRDVKIPKKINKVVSIGHGVTRLLVYMDDDGDVLGKIVGIDQKDQNIKSPRLSYAFTHPSISKLESVGMGRPFTLNIEKVLKLMPDVVISSIDVDEKQIKTLEKNFNIPVIIVDDGYLLNSNSDEIIKNEFYRSLTILGSLFNKKDKVQDLTNYIKASLNDLKSRIPVEHCKESVYVGGLGFRGPQGIFSSRAHSVFLNFLSLNNALDTMKKESSKVILDKEKLLTLNPDYIFIDMSGKDIFFEEYAKNKDFFNMLKAFSRKKVFYINPQEAYGYNIESILMNLYFMGDLFYPVNFQDVDLTKKYNEISNVFLGSKSVITPGHFFN